MADPVQHHLGDGALPFRRFGRRLVIDGGGQAIERAQPIGRAGPAEQERPRRRIGEAGDRDRGVDRDRVFRRDPAQLGGRGGRRLGLEAGDRRSARPARGAGRGDDRLADDARNGHREQSRHGRQHEPRAPVAPKRFRHGSCSSSRGRWPSFDLRLSYCTIYIIHVGRAILRFRLILSRRRDRVPRGPRQRGWPLSGPSQPRKLYFPNPCRLICLRTSDGGRYDENNLVHLDRRTGHRCRRRRRDRPVAPGRHRRHRHILDVGGNHQRSRRDGPEAVGRPWRARSPAVCRTPPTSAT